VTICDRRDVDAAPHPSAAAPGLAPRSIPPQLSFGENSRSIRALSRTGSGLAALAALLFAREVQAAGGFSLSWQAPDACGTQADFEAGVSRVVGKSFAELGSAWKTADVVIVASADNWRLRVSVVSTSGTRRERDVVTGTCREAVEAAELIVATSLSGAEPIAAPSDTRTGESNARSPNAAAPSAPGGPEANTPPPANLPRASERAKGVVAAPSDTSRGALHESRLNVAVGARFGVEPLLLPTATTIGWGMLAIESQRLRAELTFGASYPESSPVPAGGGAVAQLLVAGGVGCYGAPAASFRLWGCAGGEAGRFSARGEPGPDLRSNKTSLRFWAAGLVQGQLSHPVAGPVDLVLGAQGVIAPHSIHVGRQDPMTGRFSADYHTQAADIRPWLGVEGRF
jgi:hypothetical protein